MAISVRWNMEIGVEALTYEAVEFLNRKFLNGNGAEFLRSVADKVGTQSPVHLHLELSEPPLQTYAELISRQNTEVDICFDDAIAQEGG